MSRQIKVVLHTQDTTIDHILRNILTSVDSVTLLQRFTNKLTRLPNGEGVMICEYSPELAHFQMKTDQKARWPRLLIGKKISYAEEMAIFQSGEAGYLTVPCQLPFLAKAIYEIANEGLWFSRNVIYKVQKQIVYGERENQTKCNAEMIKELLTKREFMVKQSVCMGLRNKEVAELLSISEKTVKLHLNSIFKKLSISSRSELMALDRNYIGLAYENIQGIVNRCL